MRTILRPTSGRAKETFTQPDYAESRSSRIHLFGSIRDNLSARRLFNTRDMACNLPRNDADSGSPSTRVKVHTTLFRRNLVSTPLSSFRGALFGLVAAALLVLVAGCGSGGGQASNAPSKGVTKVNGLPVLHWYGLEGTPTWANTLDPSQVTDSISYNILDMVDAGLVKLLPNGNVAPDLATWTVSPNRLVYTFHLLPNLRFNNGDKLTAQDVAWSLTRSLAKSTVSPVAMPYLGHIKGAAALNTGKTSTLSGVKVLNSRTIQISLDQPIAFFLRTLTYPTADVLDPRIMAGKKAQTFLTDSCSGNVGAGPFMFKCLNKSSAQTSFYHSGQTHQMTLVPNPHYHGAKPHIEIVMPVIPDAQTNYRDFQSGGIDATVVPSADLSSAKHKTGFTQFPTSAVDYITPNEQSPPFSNVHCRLAVAYAIDRNAIDNGIWRGLQTPIYDVVPRGLLGYYNGANNPHYNPRMARKELALCPGGLHGLTMTYQHTSVDIDNEYAAVTHMLSAVGIGMKLNPLTFNAWLNIVQKPLVQNKTAITENLWIEDYPDPYDYCTLLLRSGQNYDIGGFNNPQYNRLVDQAAVEANPTKRAQLYIKAQHIAVSQGAWIPIGEQVYAALVNPKVHGLTGSEA